MKKISQNRFYIWLSCSVFVLMVLACATKTQTKSGFLDSYGSLRSDPKVKGIYIYENPEKKLKESAKLYTAFMIDPVIIYFHPESRGQGVNSDELKSLVDYFHTEMSEALEDRYSIVDTPGPEVLRIRVAFTNVLPVKPRLDLHLATTNLSLGEASMEADFVDSKSGVRIAAVLDSRNNESQMPLHGREVQKHATDVIDKWVGLLKEILDIKNEE